MGYRDINKLFAESAGRCNFPNCKETLYYEYADESFVSLGEICHIIGESSEGPRGDPTLSEILNKEESNFVLFCRKHHKIVDGNPMEFSIEKLLKMKDDHKQWVKSQLDSELVSDWTLIIHSGNISGTGILIDEDLIFKDFLGSYLFTNVEKIEIDEFLTETSNWDKYIKQQELWWQKYLAKESKPNKFVICSINFIPLVIHLGYIIHDTFVTELFHFNRILNSWKWEKIEEKNSFKDYFNIQWYYKEVEIEEDLSLSISISGLIQDEDIFESIGKETGIIKILVDSPHRNWLKFKEQLIEFQTKFIELIDFLSIGHPNIKRIHLFLASPTPIALLIGGSLNPNIHPKFVIYNYNSKNVPKYQKSIELN